MRKLINDLVFDNKYVFALSLLIEEIITKNYFVDSIECCVCDDYDWDKFALPNKHDVKKFSHE